MPPNTLTCACCNTKIEDKLLTIQCSICRKYYRNTCCGISSNELRVMSGNKGYDWTCRNCSSFKNDFNDLKTFIAGLQEEIKNLKSSNVSLLDEIKALKSIPNANNPNNSLDVEEIIQEIEERSRRKCNIVVFGLEESDQNATAELRNNNDRTVVQNMLQIINPNENYTVIKQIRLGKYLQGGKRPVKIVLNNDLEVQRVIKNAKRLKNDNFFKQVTISYDRTPKQIAYYRELRQELIRRKEEDPVEGASLRIKYVNGLPKIIKQDLN